MKSVLLSVVVLFSFQSAMAALGEGSLVFKKDGELAKMPAAMEHVVSKGPKGEVKHELVISVEHEGKKVAVKASRLRVKMAHGRLNLIAVFAPKGAKGRVIFNGTALKGETSGIYYGDIYVMGKKAELSDELFDAIEEHEKEEHNEGGKKIQKPRIHHVGGFMFKFVK